MLKEMKPGRKYFIINIDEPYAHEIYEILRKGETLKGTWKEGYITFQEWAERTFDLTELEKKKLRVNSENPYNKIIRDLKIELKYVEEMNEQLKKK